MSEPRESMTAFITSDDLDHDSLQAFLNAKRDGGTVRWRGMCWEILEHRSPSEQEGYHAFRLASASTAEC